MDWSQQWSELYKHRCLMDDLHRLLFSKCNGTNIDAVLLDAIIQVESSWKPKVMRFESKFAYMCRPDEFAEKNGLTLATEIALQKFSYGLCQLMGGTARELGFEGFLPDLLSPDVNFEFMLKYWMKTCDQYTYTSDKIAAYNAGSAHRLDNGQYFNQIYVDRVYAAMHQETAKQNVESVSN